MWLSSVRRSALLSQSSTGTMTDSCVKETTTQARKADKVQDATDESEFIHMPETIHTRLRWIYELNSRCPIPFRSIPSYPMSNAPVHANRLACMLQYASLCDISLPSSCLHFCDQAQSAKAM
jgi:hypothetical protein